MVPLDLHRGYRAPDRGVQLRCNTAPARRSRWATLARSHRDGESPRSLLCANEIVRMRVQLFPVNIAPGFFGVVLSIEVDGARAPIVLLARDVIAPFKQKNLLTGGRELVSQRAAARACADNDYVVVVVVRHDPLRLLTKLMEAHCPPQAISDSSIAWSRSSKEQCQS